MKVIVPSWYAEQIGPPCVSADEAIVEQCPRWLARLAKRLAVARGFALFWAGRSADTVAVIKKDPGTVTLLALEALARKRRVVVLEFLPRAAPTSRLRRHVFGVWSATIERPALRRAMRVGQVLTATESLDYAKLYRISKKRLVLVPWALVTDASVPPPFEPGSSGVMASGRAACDWETLFAAAEETEWPLTVICGSRDLDRISILNARGRAEVFCDISHIEHDEKLREAAVFAICLQPIEPSAGHVRLMTAVAAGTPVVATDLAGLRDYVEDGETAVLVPPQDPTALREAIDALVKAPDERRRLRETASARARDWTLADYFKAIRELLTIAN